MRLFLLKIKQLTFLALFLCLSPLLDAQSTNDEYKLIKKTNDNMDFVQQYILEFKSRTKIKFENDTYNTTYLVDFTHYAKDGAFTYFREKTPWEYKYQNDSLFSRKRDSLNWRFQRKLYFRWKTKKIPGQFYFLRDLPFSSLGFYKGWENVSLGYDSVNHRKTLLQKRKNSKDKRVLFYDKNYLIHQINYLYPEDELGDLEETRFIRHTENNIVELARKLGGYEYRPDSTYKPRKIKDSSEIKYIIPLVPVYGEDTLVVKHKYLLVDLWYISCPPCYYIRPYLESIYAECDSAKIQCLGYNKINDHKEITAICTKRNYRIPEINSELWNPPFGDVHEHPTILLISPNGEIIKRWIGYSQDNVADIRNTLKYL